MRESIRPQANGQTHRRVRLVPIVVDVRHLHAVKRTDAHTVDFVPFGWIQKHLRLKFVPSESALRGYMNGRLMRDGYAVATNVDRFAIMQIAGTPLKQLMLEFEARLH